MIFDSFWDTMLSLTRLWIIRECRHFTCVMNSWWVFQQFFDALIYFSLENVKKLEQIEHHDNLGKQWEVELVYIAISWHIFVYSFDRVFQVQ